VFGMGTGVAPPASPPGIENEAASCLAATKHGDSRVQPDAFPTIASMYESNVVKPHGRLVPVS
jgi:hypothetical protein